MKIEILEDTNLALSPTEIRFFVKGQVIDKDTLTVERRKRLVDLALARVIVEKVKKSDNPVKEDKADNPVVKDKSVKSVKKNKNKGEGK
jgi:hypothetical protein